MKWIGGLSVLMATLIVQSLWHGAIVHAAPIQIVSKTALHAHAAHIPLASQPATFDWGQLLQKYFSRYTNGHHGTRSVPVPETIALFGAGFAGFMAWRHGRSRRGR